MDREWTTDEQQADNFSAYTGDLKKVKNREQLNAVREKLSNELEQNPFYFSYDDMQEWKRLVRSKFKEYDREDFMAQRRREAALTVSEFIDLVNQAETFKEISMISQELYEDPNGNFKYVNKMKAPVWDAIKIRKEELKGAA